MANDQQSEKGGGVGSSVWLAELKRRVGAIGREFEACNKTIANMERKKKGLLKQSKRIWKIIDAESSANGELSSEAKAPA